MVKKKNKGFKFWAPVKPDEVDDYGYLVWSNSINCTCKTDGKGLWSNETRTLNHKEMTVKTYLDPDYLEDWFNYFTIDISFNQKDWNIDKHGLVYTDKGWLKEFRNYLVSLGFTKAAAQDVEYTEQGSQGSGYISLCGGIKFAQCYFDVFYPKK
jgi:hypothetical protein